MNQVEFNTFLTELKYVENAWLRRLATKKNNITSKDVSKLIWHTLAPYMIGQDQIEDRVLEIIYLLLEADIIPDDILMVSTFSWETVKMMELLLFVMNPERFDTTKVVSAIWTHLYRRMILSGSRDERDEYRNIGKDLTSIFATCSIFFDKDYIEPPQDNLKWFPMCPIPNQMIFGSNRYNMWQAEVQRIRGQPMRHIPREVLELQFK